MPVVVIVVGFADSSTLINNAVELGASNVTAMIDGAILALIWFGMPKQFEETA